MNDPHVVLHLGAHKTATTHLQHSIHAARRQLDGAGVRFFGPPALRQPGTRIEARFDLPFNPRKSVADHRPAREVLAEMMDGGTRLVLSEENFIGSLFDRRYPGPFHSLPVPLYPDAALRLAALAARVAPDRGLDLCLGIRDPAGFLNSAYGLVLQAGSGVDMDGFKRRNPLFDIDWVHLVRRLRQAEGVGRVTVWRHEDYRPMFDRVVAALVGEGVGPIRPVARVVNPGLSTKAVAVALECRATGASGPVVQQARDSFPVGSENPPHDGFDAEEHALSAEFYAAQVAELAQMDGVTLLRPDGPA